MAIPFYYDPMIAKMICHAETREAAIEKTIRAIDEYQITGVETTLGFCKFVMQHQAFRSGQFDTKFVENHFKPEYLTGQGSPETDLMAALISTMAIRENRDRQSVTPTESVSAGSKWKTHRS